MARIDDPLDWLSRPCVMGVLNATPDSFSDGGRYLAPDAARRRLRQVFREGAAVCDVGAESTRPGAEPVPADEQLRRLDPVFSALAESADVPVSVDTASGRVAQTAIEAGAVLVNDITAGRGDDIMFDVVARGGVAMCLMHMRGTPRTMQDAPSYSDPVGEVMAFFDERLTAATSAGIPERHLLLDPGIGFGKRLSDNLALLAGIGRLTSLGRPIIVGVSRKRMFEDLLNRPLNRRLAGSLSAGLWALDRGAHVLRVHDVAATVDAVRTWTAIEGAG